MHTTLLKYGLSTAGVLLILCLCLAALITNYSSASGPFYGTPYQASLDALTVSGRAAYKSGQLVSYSADESHGPIIAYLENGKRQWAVGLTTGDDPALRVAKIVEMQVSYGLIRDRIDFFAVGLSEPGWLTIEKISGTKKFYLRMF